MATRFLQNRRLMRRITHSLTVRQTSSFRNDRPFTAANFQPVTIRVLEEKCIVASTVLPTDFRTFKRFAARLTHQLRKAIHFFSCIRPECDSRAIWLMIFVSLENEKFCRLVAASGIKGMIFPARPFLNKSKLRQKFSIKLSRGFHVFHS